MLRAVTKASCIIVYPSRDLYNQSHLYAHDLSFKKASEKENVAPSSDTKKLKRSLSPKLIKNKRNMS